MKKKLSSTEIQRLADDFFSSFREELGLPDGVDEKARRTKPLLVKNLAGDPSYWIVPAVTKDRLVSFLRLGLKGELLAFGRFGQGRRLAEFPLRSNLSLNKVKREMQRAFGSRFERIELPQLVHDGPADRIAWLSKGIDVKGKHMLLFWTFGASYSRPEETKANHGMP